MSNIIKLKRGLSSNVDTLTLERGELALTTDTNELLSVNDAGVIESITPHLLDNGKIKEEYLPEFSKENTTYVLTKNGMTITLTGSDGSTTAVSDSDTKTIVDGFLDSASTNAIQNKVVYNAINEIPKIYMGDTEPTDLNVLLWIDTGVENTDPVEISFTVGGLRCMGEEGMTWDEWIDSGYNFDPRVAISNSGGIIYRNGSLLQLNGNGVAVQATDIIEPNGVYTTMAFPD